MNRKIYLLLTVLLAWSFNLKAQTAQIESIPANPGASVSIDVTVDGLPADVGAVSLFIGYDPNVLTFTGSTPGDPEFAGYFINNMVGSHQIGIQWTDPYGADINGVLLSLNFIYSGLGGTCDITFAAGCEFTDINLNSIDVAYTNGFIGPNAGTATITIDESFYAAGPITLGVTGANFTEDAGAITLYMAFDNSVLQYSGYSTTIGSGLFVNGDNSTGIIGVTYSSTSGADLNTTFLTLNFNYDGTNVTELVFQQGCEIAYLDLTNPVVSFDNGKVSPVNMGYVMEIGNLQTNPGNVVQIPVTASGYPGNMGAITLFIGFNSAHLDFVGITDGLISGAFGYLAGEGLIGITWSGMGTDINGPDPIFYLNFDYNFGASEITFEGGCEITDDQLNLIPSFFDDGSISPIVGGPELRLPFLTGTIGQTISFPITAKNFIVDAGAVSLFIGYNDDVLTYTGFTPGVLANCFVNNMSATSQVGIQWSDLTGYMFADDDILITLNFTYIGGECDLTFNGGCELAQPDLTFIPVAYYDGSVITGTLFDLKVFLEGPFFGGTMNAYLNLFGLLPLAQPYNIDPIYYAGTENVTVIPNANVVDWVLVEIRETAGDVNTADASTVVARKAAFLLDNGSVVDLDGSSNLLIPSSFTENVFVVIYHRNHAKIISADALTQVGGVYVYDFTDDAAKAYGSYQKDLTGAGPFGMYSGDIDNDGEIFSNDVTLLLNEYPSTGVYSGSDIDLDGEVFSNDVSLLLNNYPLVTFIP